MWIGRAWMREYAEQVVFLQGDWDRDRGGGGVKATVSSDTRNAAGPTLGDCILP